MTSIGIIRYEEATPQRWRNDGGWTREIARGGEAEDWDWRVSIADVETDGPFSRFPGIEREIVLLSGAGMHFDFGDGEAFDLTPETPRLRFDGDRALDSHLLDGPTRDFNLMWARDRIDAELWLRPMVGSATLAVAAGETWLIHVASGGLVPQGANPGTLVAGDTAWLRADTASRTWRYEGTGQAIVIRLRDRAPG